MRNLNNISLTRTQQLNGVEETWILQSAEPLASVSEVIEYQNRIGLVTALGFDPTSAVKPVITFVLMCPENVEDHKMWFAATLKAQLSMQFGKLLGIEHEQ
jgi:hypothetical protein